VKVIILKILIVNSFDSKGGAARAAYRLYSGLLKFNIEAELLVQKSTSNDNSVLTFDNSEMLTFDTILLTNYINIKTYFSNSIISNSNLINYINESDADIVHLHWITNSFLSIEDIGKITKPIVFTMHDNWLFTGGCHIMGECINYKNECGNCHILNSNEINDISNINWNRKKKVFNNLNKNTYVIGLSKWVTNKAKKSSLINKFNIINLPNPINSEYYVNINKDSLRKKYKIYKNKKIVIFGAMSSTSDLNKGYHLLLDSLSKLKSKNIELLIFGNDDNIENFNNFHINSFGKIEDDQVLIELYNLSDVMIVPSLQENLPNVIIEAFSSSLPVVAFNIGGIPDIIDHKINGYLAKAFNTQDLADGIEWILHHPNYDELCKNARKKVLSNFSEEIVIPKYIKLYKKILKELKYSKNNFKESTDIKLSNLYIETFNKYVQKENSEKEIYFSKNFNKFFEQISLIDENIILYGYGTIGKTIQKLIPEKIIGYIDMNDNNNHPSTLRNMKYDKILISVLGREKEIKRYLVKELSVPKNKIITIEL